MNILHTLYQCVAGLDVHRMLLVITVLIQLPDGNITKQQRSFGAFKRDLLEMVAWLQSLSVELVVMESTSVYWKNVYAALEAANINVNVVNAHHIKNVPGRKTDIKDAGR